MFICIEGIDGSGKSTQARMVADRLKEHGVDVLATYQPTKNGVGKFIRDILSGNKPGEVENLYILFAADRCMHLSDVVKPALEAGKTVIMDRYILSSLVYQGDKAVGVNDSFITPDLTIIIDVDAQTAMSRVHSRGEEGQSIFESAGELEKLRDRYMMYANNCKEPHIIVDGNADATTVTDRIMDAILKWKTEQVISYINI